MVRRSGSSAAFPEDDGGDSLPLTHASNHRGRGGSYHSIPTTTPPLAASTSSTTNRSSTGHQQQQQLEDDNAPPTVTYSRSSLNISTPSASASSSSSSSTSSPLTRLWRLTEGGQRGFHLLQGGAVLAVGALCLGVGVLIGQSQAQVSFNSSSSNGLSPLNPQQLQDAQAEWPAQPLLGNAWTPQDVQSLFTAYHFTDAHIEPLYDKDQVSKGTCRNPDCCKKGKNLCEAFTYNELELPTLGCDPPVSLLEGVLEAMKAVDPDASYVLFTGDMNAHHLCTEELVRATQEEFFRRVNRALPHLPFVYAIGNNDLWPNNKNSEHNFEALYQLQLKECPQCALFQGPEEDKEENARLFRSAGFYGFRDPAKKLKVLVLNSGLWSPRYDNADLPRSLPDAHMDWVETELQAAKEGGEKVIIISHIPPGHVRHSEDWSERYLDRYITLCTRYVGTISAQFYGHHSKEYIRSFSPEVGVLCSAGVTPLGGGSLAFPGEKDAANPTFRHVIFTEEGFYDMWSFYLDLSSGENDRLIARGKEAKEGGKGEKNKNKKRKFVVMPANEDATEDGEEGGVLFPSSSRKEKDRAAFVASLERQAGGTAGRGGGGVSSKFVAAIKAANSKGWDLMYSFRETYKCPDVSPASIHLAAQRILRDSHYTSRYEMYLGGLHSPHRLITCDVHTRTWDSVEVEACFDRLCVYDVSQECSDFEGRKRHRQLL